MAASRANVGAPEMQEWLTCVAKVHEKGIRTFSCLLGSRERQGRGCWPARAVLRQAVLCRRASATKPHQPSPVQVGIVGFGRSSARCGGAGNVNGVSRQRAGAHRGQAPLAGSAGCTGIALIEAAALEAASLPKAEPSFALPCSSLTCVWSAAGSTLWWLRWLDQAARVAGDASGRRGSGARKGPFA